MKTVFEKSVKGRRGVQPSALDVERYDYESYRLREELVLPELSEPEVAAHYTALSKRTFGVDDGFYPLGSCTMKYNPKLHEEIAALPGFANAHPLARADKVQGCLAVIDTLSAYLAGRGIKEGRESARKAFSRPPSRKDSSKIRNNSRFSALSHLRGCCRACSRRSGKDPCTATPLRAQKARCNSSRGRPWR